MTEPEVPLPRPLYHKIVLALIVVTVVGLPLWGLLRRDKAPPPLPPPKLATTPVPPPEVLVPATTPPIRESPASKPGTASVAPAPEARSGILELDVDPAVEVLVDGRSAGRSPVRMTVSAGKHTVRLVDRVKGIDVVRSVTVGGGKRVSDRMTIGKGTIAVTAPEGSVVFIDGRKIGPVPLEPIEVYEGAHKMVVTLGEMKHEQRFNARPGDKLTLEVHRKE